MSTKPGQAQTIRQIRKIRSIRNHSRSVVFALTVLTTQIEGQIRRTYGG